MPVKIPDGLPAGDILALENIFVMTDKRAKEQDIRPLRIVIFNLMPTKLVTETQLLRVLGNTALQVEITFMHTASYESKNTDKAHLSSFYRTFDEIKDEQFDGLIITGAPVEQMEFTKVAYWEELCAVFDWAEKNVFSSFFICWAAQAAMQHYYGINKSPLEKKLFGVFEHDVCNTTHRLMRGFDDTFFAPHSRHTTVNLEDVRNVSDIEVLATSDDAGLYIAASHDGSRIFVTGHSEYDQETLKLEYDRDVAANLPIEVPKNYFPNDDDTKTPRVSWHSHGNLLYGNWLNYFVYQDTPFDLKNVYEEKQQQRKVIAEGKSK